MLFLDCETSGLDKKKDQLHGIAVYKEGGEGKYFTADSLSPELLATLADPTIPKCGHNLIEFDVPFLKAKGINVRGKLHDTRHMAYLLDENNGTGLKELVEKYFGKEFLSNKSELDKVLSETGCAHVGHLALKDRLDPTHPYRAVIAEYAIEDVKNTAHLFNALKKKMEELDAKIKRIFTPTTKTPLNIYLEETVPFENVKAKMQSLGVLIDPSRIAEARIALGKEIEQLEKDLWEITHKEQEEVAVELSQLTLEKKLEDLKTEAGKERLKGEAKRWTVVFAWTKPIHTLRLLDKLAIPGSYYLQTDKGGRSLDKEGIANLLEKLDAEHVAYRVVALFAALKKVRTLVANYTGTEEKGGGILEHVDEQMTVHPSYGSFLVTGRLSCSNPNLQQLPRQSAVKSFFIPRPEKVFLHFDASQVELRIAAHLSQDETLIEAYQNAEDLHILTAEAFFGGTIHKDDEERQVGKESNFLLIFDGSAGRLQKTLKLKAKKLFSLEECSAFKQSFFDRYPGYKAYLQQQLEQMKRTQVVLTETGRIRRLPDIKLGQYVDYRTKSLKAPPAEVYKDLVAQLHRQKVQVTDRTIFEAASKRFSHAKKQGYNFPIQGLGASIVKRGIVNVSKAGYSIVNTVHDSIDVEVDKKNAVKELGRVQQILESSYKLRVPLVFEGKILNSFNEKDVFEGK